MIWPEQRRIVPDPLRAGAVQAQDGRRLAYMEYGSTTGEPVVLIPGAASGAFMAFGGSALLEHDVRLISVDRPGLGGSDPDASKSFESVASDIGDLIDALVGRPVPVVANSQGAPFGIATALSGAATRLVLVSPSDEVAFPATTGLLHPHLRQLVGTVGASASGEAVAMFESFTATSFFDMVMANPAPADEDVYDDPGFRDRFLAVVRAGFRQGARGYAQDTALAMAPWGLDLAELPVPVDILVGRDDEVHSPDRGELLAGRMANAARTVIDDAGSALLWSHPGLVVDRLLR
jgi:pimeloyl-ACP methyl ester carboxylesterase